MIKKKTFWALSVLFISLAPGFAAAQTGVWPEGMPGQVSGP